MIHKFFIEFFDADSINCKCLGTLPVHESNGRQQGMSGQEFITVTKPLELHRGHKLVVYKASEKKPLKLRTMMQPMMGRDESFTLPTDI